MKLFYDILAEIFRFLYGKFIILFIASIYCQYSFQNLENYESQIDKKIENWVLKLFGFRKLSDIYFPIKEYFVRSLILEYFFYLAIISHALSLSEIYSCSSIDAEFQEFCNTSIEYIQYFRLDDERVLYPSALVTLLIFRLFFYIMPLLWLRFFVSNHDSCIKIRNYSLRLNLSSKNIPFFLFLTFFSIFSIFDINILEYILYFLGQIEEFRSGIYWDIGVLLSSISFGFIIILIISPFQRNSEIKITKILGNISGFQYICLILFGHLSVSILFFSLSILIYFINKH